MLDQRCLGACGEACHHSQGVNKVFSAYKTLRPCRGLRKSISRVAAHPQQAENDHLKLDGDFSLLTEATRRELTIQQLQDVYEEQDTVLKCISDDSYLLKGCESRKKLKVAVLLSGGVDSSLALYLLRRAGHDVTAFYLQIWFQEDFENFWGSCPWEDDLGICKQVCSQVDVPLRVVPLTTEYWNRVVADSLESIKRGWTPNPDIHCNTRVKFGAFLEHLDQKGESFDRIASGHYATISRDAESDVVTLERSPDDIKDQTYFLSHLSQSQLSRVMFPIGHFSKDQVRQLAHWADLPNMARRDSQGICFLGKVRFDEFVEKHLGTWHGPLVDEDTNEVVGFHKGFWFYTPGQRKGIELSGGPWYVSKKDTRKNVVYISRTYHVPDRIRNQIRCGHFAWISGQPPEKTRLLCKHNCGFKSEGEILGGGAMGYLFGATMGLFCTLYSHAIRKKTLNSKPWEHLIGIGIGGYIGQWLDDYEKRTELEIQELIKRREERNKNISRISGADRFQRQAAE